eukprot:GHUV01021414.1.p1 GENE.GHUV01021414.1~~GHUV01021414.1.p1  ORF type:complete len:534 (+),score=85.13 GHUV01021414.1:759-2360(+)
MQQQMVQDLQQHSHQPIYGFITDSFPISGMKRRPYLIIAGLTGSLSWLCLAAFARSIPSTIACITAAAAATAFSDVVADSIVVELARASPGATEGALQSLCWGAHAFGRVITAYLSGWLVDKVGPQTVFVITATFPLVVCMSSCLINERKLGTMVDSMPESAACSKDPCGSVGGLICHPTTTTAAASSSDAGALTLPASRPAHSLEVLSGRQTPDRFQLNHRASSFNKDQQQQQSNETAATINRTESTGSDSHFHTDGHSRLMRLWHQLFGSLTVNVGLFWRAIKQPHVLRPVVFLFLWQATPGVGTAMFYFKTNKLGFNAEFFGRVKLVAAIADLLGIVVYNSFLKTVRLRPLMLWGSLLGCALGLTPLMLVEGVNRKIGISDKVFALVDSALLSSIGQILMMPTLVLAARLCPEGVEATLYASLMSLNNAAVGVGEMLGALLMKVFGITSSNFVHLSMLLLTCNLLSLLPLPLIGWVPDESTKGIEKLGNYQPTARDDNAVAEHEDDVSTARSTVVKLYGIIDTVQQDPHQ